MSAKVTIVLLCMVSIFPLFHFVDSLKCFSCSEHRGRNVRTNDCPKSGDDLNSWKTQYMRYPDVGSVEKVSCALRVTGDGDVFHQGWVSRELCNNSQAVRDIQQLVNSHSGKAGSRSGILRSRLSYFDEVLAQSKFSNFFFH